MKLTFQIQSVRLDSNTIVADVHSDGYDVEFRVDAIQYAKWGADNDKSDNDWYSFNCGLNFNDTELKSDIQDYLNQSPYLLSCLRDAIRLKEIEAIIYECDMLRIINCSELNLNEKECNHLHSLITQYGDGRVETEGLKIN